MASSSLPNYLKADRKRLGLTQDDVAFLLGGEDGEVVCRHERFTREPSLKTALAYEAVYGRPVRELFAGAYEEIDEQVKVRIKKLADAVRKRAPSHQNARKRQTLLKMAARQNETSEDQL